MMSTTTIRHVADFMTYSSLFVKDALFQKQARTSFQTLNGISNQKNISFKCFLNILIYFTAAWKLPINAIFHLMSCAMNIRKNFVLEVSEALVLVRKSATGADRLVGYVVGHELIHLRHRFTRKQRFIPLSSKPQTLVSRFRVVELLPFQ